MRDFVRYLMGENRDKVLKTPIPQQNIFENYSFVNSDSFRNNTKIIPEFVVESLKNIVLNCLNHMICCLKYIYIRDSEPKRLHFLSMTV